MFYVKIIDVKATLYDGKAQGVYFNVEGGGQRGILAHHMNADFKVTPSCLYVFTETEKIQLFIGYGYARMNDNFLAVTGIPIARTFEEFNRRIDKLKEYGEICKKDFIFINL